MECLMKAADDKGKKYIYNFVLDFFSISEITLDFFYNIKIKRKKRENINEIIWKMAEQYGKKYIATTLAKTVKFTYSIRKRRYIYFRK